MVKVESKFEYKFSLGTDFYFHFEPYGMTEEFSKNDLITVEIIIVNDKALSIEESITIEIKGNDIYFCVIPVVDVKYRLYCGEEKVDEWGW